MWSADKIRDLRKRYGETQEVFCRRLGVKVETLKYWEQGKGAPLGPAQFLLSRLEEDIESGQKRELEAEAACS